MRTGSNLLEANLNALAGVQCHGEAFNPSFIGYPANKPILGVDQAARDRDPQRLLNALFNGGEKLLGIRYFHDHDPRVFDALLANKTCAKIILTRNPVERYVSWKIAQRTGQWKLTDAKAHKPGQAVFDAAEFSAHLSTQQTFQLKLMRALQTSGQTAYYIAYEDLQELDVLNGLAAFLGVSDRLTHIDQSLKKQNPGFLSDKVQNFDEMCGALARHDWAALNRTPNFEPRRGPAVPTYLAAARAPLLYLPLRGGPQAEVVAWLAALDGVREDALQTQMTQKDLRHWKRAHPGHRSFTVLRHPVARAHHAFCRHILPVGPGAFLKLRSTLMRRYGLPLPPDGPDEAYDVPQHSRAFKAFLSFLKPNLSGQTAVRVDPTWCTQAQALEGFSQVCFADILVREADLATELPALARNVGCTDTSEVPRSAPDQPYPLEAIYDAKIEAMAQAAYQRDYMMFGFAPWR
ncbi:MAG: nodulation protein NodH [Pseudomonadota bacterium]